MKGTAIILASVSLLAGCDSILLIRGVAPKDQSCLLRVIDQDSGTVANTFTVQGPFEENLIFGGLGSPNFAIEAECNKKIVKSMRDLRVRHGEFDVGTIEP